MKRTRQVVWSLAVLSMSSMASMTLAGELFLPNGVTKPTQRAEMGFPIQGLIKAVLVKAGDSVKVGQPLVQLDDSVEKKELESILVEANSDVEERAAVADLAQKKVELERKKQIQVNGGQNDAEVEDAQLAVTIGELKVENAKQQTLKKKAECEVQQKKIDHMVMVSQIAGTVEKIDWLPGEVADPNKPASVAVTDNTKLNVEASLPTASVNKLKIGDKVEVRYENEPQVHTAKIIFLSPVADAASSSRLLRAEMTNDENKPAGMSVAVKLSDQPLVEGR